MARPRTRLALTCFGLWLACAAPALAAAKPPPTPTVRVAFSKPQGSHSLVGFVHGMDADTPGDSLIAPLRPSLWRGKLQDVPYGRVNDLGGLYTYVLGDRWGYPGAGLARPAPFEDYSEWRKFVKKTAERARDREDVVFDVWNEPDDPYFWAGTPEQLYETYRIAWETLHKILGPGVQVSGPSTSYYSPEWIGGLMDYCLARGCGVDVLSWHEFPPRSIPGIETRVDEARARWIDDPRYDAVGVRAIHLNEVIGAPDQYLPGETLGYMRYMERAGVEAAARGCWFDFTGVSNCYNETLSGLLEPGTLRPRSVWWTTKAYADGAGSRVLTKFDDPYVVGIGSSASTSPNAAQLMIGNLERRVGTRKSTDSTKVEITFRKLSALGFLRGAKRVKIAIQAFPATGAAPLPAPVSRRGKVHTISKDEVALTLHDVRLHAAYRLLLTLP